MSWRRQKSSYKLIERFFFFPLLFRHCTLLALSPPPPFINPRYFLDWKSARWRTLFSLFSCKSEFRTSPCQLGLRLQATAGLLWRQNGGEQIFSMTLQSMDVRRDSKWFLTWLNDIIDLIIQSFIPPWGILKRLGGNKQIRLIERDLERVSQPAHAHLECVSRTALAMRERAGD